LQISKACAKILKKQGEEVMRNTACTNAYRYFSFTGFFGKAYFGMSHAGNM